MDLIKEDILSKIMRKFVFDETGFLGFKMYVVEKSEIKQKEKDKQYLEYTNCIYTIVEDGRYKNGDEDIKYNIYSSIFKWGKEQGIEPLGVAFANTRLVTYADNKERVFIEIYSSIKSIT